MNSMYDFGKRSIIYLNFSFTPSLTSSINLSYYSLYKNKSLSTKNLHKFYKNIAQQIEFKRLVFAMAVLQAPFSLTQWLTDSSFSYCVSHVKFHLSRVSIYLDGLISMELAPSSCFLIIFVTPLISFRHHVYFHFLVQF